MNIWNRRDLAKAGIAASATALTGGWSVKRSIAENQAVEVQYGGATLSPMTAGSRERLLMDRGWRFALGHASDPDKDFGFGKTAELGVFAKSGEAGGPAGIKAKSPFDDHVWEIVDLPHDWAVGLPFVLERDVVWHGGKPVGREFPATSVGWYRRSFDVPAGDLGKRISLEFDGIFRDAMLFVNGHYLTANFSGYAPAVVDVTDFLNYGESNVVTVRVDASYAEGWFYEGAGIYRHVWLNKTGPLHVTQWGSFVRSEVKDGYANLKISTEVANDALADATCRVRAFVIDTKGATVVTATSAELRVEVGAVKSFEMQARVVDPALWSIEQPNLYKLVAIVEKDGHEVDRDETTFGVRTIRFDADKGFFLNGKPVKIKGTCNHQDHAGVGVALPDRLQSFRIERLKEMGSNAYRTSHNAPTPELLDACDRLGMLVLDETRMFSSGPEGLSELERMVRRDRNHPSVVIWSIANEERQQGTERGARIGGTMKRLVQKLDPTRPVTAAMNGNWGKGLSGVVDVQGFNYYLENIDAYREKFPKQPLMGTETASTVSTRGIYADDAVKGYVAAYDNRKPKWGATAEEWWKFYAARDWLAGGFVWTGFDYRGEPTPYHLPCVSSHFGLMDTCGFPKDNYFYYKTWWAPEPALHLLPHWTWPGREGEEIEVWCYCNQQSVELFLNGVSLGSQTVERNGHLVWKVKYAPGKLEARASASGRVVLTAANETAGAASKLVLTADRVQIQADGEDVSIVTVQVVDAKGRPVPVAANKISFALQGPGRLLGVGNGDPSCYESDRPMSPTTASRSVFNGLCMAIVQSSRESGEITIVASSPGLETAKIVVGSLQSTPRASVAVVTNS